MTVVRAEHLKIEMALALKTEAYAPDEVCYGAVLHARSVITATSYFSFPWAWLAYQRHYL